MVECDLSVQCLHGLSMSAVVFSTAKNMYKRIEFNNSPKKDSQ